MSTATVGDFMTRRVETISAASSVQEAAKKMKDKDISSVVVVDDRNKPWGLITERDIVRKVCIYDNVIFTCRDYGINLNSISKVFLGTV